MTEPLTFRLRHMFACACKEPAEAADRIEKLETALREIADASSTFGVATYANYYAIAKRALHEPMSEPEARIAINEARKALEGKDETIG